MAIYIATALMSELLTNNAAGAIMYPIAAIAGDQLGVTPRELSVAIMLGASAGFINPFRCVLVGVAAGWDGMGWDRYVQGAAACTCVRARMHDDW